MITISNARKINKGALIGFVDVTLASGLKLNSCALLEKAGKRWVGMPSKEFVKADGTKAYQPIVEFASREISDRFMATILPLVTAALT